MSGRVPRTITRRVGLVAALVMATVSAVVPGRAAASPVASAAAYLRHAVNPDGGLGPAPGQRSDPLDTGWAALGLAAVGADPARVAGRDGATVLGYVRRTAPAATRGDVGALERTILVAVASGANPAAFGGHDLLSALRGHVARSGAVAGQVNLTAFGVLAFRAGGARADAARIAAGQGWLAREADRDGGFGYAHRGEGSDADDTGAVLEALARARGAAAATARRRAVAYLGADQDRDGGFPAEPGAGSNAQSTAWAIQGLIAFGARSGTVVRRGDAYLRSLVTRSGAVDYARGQSATPVWVTAEALAALAGRALPLAPPAR